MKKLRVGVVGLGHRGRLIADIVGLFDEMILTKNDKTDIMGKILKG